MERFLNWLFPSRTGSIVPAEWHPDDRKAFMIASHVVGATAKALSPR